MLILFLENVSIYKDIKQRGIEDTRVAGNKEHSSNANLDDCNKLKFKKSERSFFLKMSNYSFHFRRVSSGAFHATALYYIYIYVLYIYMFYIYISPIYFSLIAETKQGEKTYVFIQSLKTWTAAREYCKTHYIELVMIESSRENRKVHAAIPPSTSAWIGLYRVPWAWSDKSDSQFRNWLTEVGLDSDDECVAESLLNKWVAKECDDRRTFICQEGDRSPQNKEII